MLWIRHAIEVTPKKKSVQNEAMRIGRLKRVGVAFLPWQDLTPDHFQP